MTMQLNTDEEDDQGAYFGQIDELSIPAFQTGGRVERTGIALVHEGEYIMPMPGSEAQITRSGQDASMVINYYFPVEIEIIGTVSEAQLRSITDYVCDTLNTALRSRL